MLSRTLAIALSIDEDVRELDIPMKLLENLMSNLGYAVSRTDDLRCSDWTCVREHRRSVGTSAKPPPQTSLPQFSTK